MIHSNINKGIEFYNMSIKVFNSSSNIELFKGDLRTR
jgi:hypothetical protein